MDAGVAAILAAFIAVLGGLVGGYLSLRATKDTLGHAERLEKARWEREDVRRHEEIRRDVYPQFLATADEGVLVTMAFLERGVDFEHRFAETHWYERQRGMLDTIELVGSEETIETARSFDRAVHRLIGGARPIRDAAIEVAEELDQPTETVGGIDDTDEASTDLMDEEVGDTSPNNADAEDLFDGGYRESLDDDDESTGLGGLLNFMKPLPYPLGSDPDPGDMYGGNPAIQIVMTRTELRVRRHEYLNAARLDLGLLPTPFPADQRHQWGPPDEVGESLDERASSEADAGE